MSDTINNFQSFLEPFMASWPQNIFFLCSTFSCNSLRQPWAADAAVSSQFGRGSATSINPPTAASSEIQLTDFWCKAGHMKQWFWLVVYWSRNQSENQIQKPMKVFLKKRRAASHPLLPFDLQGNKIMKHLTSTSTNLNVLGVNLWVMEVEEVNFQVKL